MNNCIIINKDDQNLIKNYLPPTGIVKGIAEFYSLFCDITRLKILSILSINELCVADICGILQLNQTTVSHQLKLLKDNQMVDCRREGKIMFYRVINPYIEKVMAIGVDNIVMHNGNFQSNIEKEENGDINDKL